MKRRAINTQPYLFATIHNTHFKTSSWQYTRALRNVIVSRFGYSFRTYCKTGGINPKLDPNKVYQTNLGVPPKTIGELLQESNSYLVQFRLYEKKVTCHLVFSKLLVPVVMYRALPAFVMLLGLSLYINHRINPSVIGGFEMTMAELTASISEQARILFHGDAKGYSHENVTMLLPDPINLSGWDLIKYGLIFALLSGAWAAWRTRNLFRAFLNSPLALGLSYESERLIEKRLIVGSGLRAAGVAGFFNLMLFVPNWWNSDKLKRMLSKDVLSVNVFLGDFLLISTAVGIWIGLACALIYQPYTLLPLLTTLHFLPRHSIPEIHGETEKETD